MLQEELLDKSRHQRHPFACGVAALDEYLHRYAAQQSEKGLATVRVLVDSAAPQTILGYYSLSAAQIVTTQLDAHIQRQLPRYPVPCFRMGRLAVNQLHQKQGLGKILLACAVQRCLLARNNVAAWALIVDAKDAAASAFYQHYGFFSCANTPLTLYLPLGTAPSSQR